jgi:hypothetical protein
LVAVQEALAGGGRRGQHEEPDRQISGQPGRTVVLADGTHAYGDVPVPNQRPAVRLMLKASVLACIEAQIGEHSGRHYDGQHGEREDPRTPAS